MYIQLFYVYMCVTTPRPLFVVLLPHLKEYYIQTSTPHVYTYYICTTTPGDSRFSINALCFSVVRFCGLISGILYNITRTIEMGCWAFFLSYCKSKPKKISNLGSSLSFCFPAQTFHLYCQKREIVFLYIYSKSLYLFILQAENITPLYTWTCSR